VLKKLELTDGIATSVLVEAVNANPLHWGAWLELAVLVTDKEMVGIAVF
jgi:anaphase-promoting complex subunit 8